MGVAATSMPRLRRGQLPTRQPGCTRFVPPAASSRTDVGSQPWPQHHIGRHAVPAVGVQHARARMYALRVAQVAQRGDRDRSIGP